MLFVLILEDRTGQDKTTKKITFYTLHDTLEFIGESVNFTSTYIRYLGLERRQGYYTQERRKRERRVKHVK